MGGRGVRFPASWYLYTHLGESSARASPRHSANPTPPHSLELRQTFKAGVTAARYMSSSQQLFSAEVSKHTWLARNDLNMATLFGRAFRIQRPSGVKMVSLPSYYDVSDLLDGIYQLKGGILVRNTNQWQGLAAGPDETVLTSNGPGQLPSWEPPAAPSGQGMSNVVQLALNNTASAVAAACKGFTWQNDYDIEIGGIWMYGNYTINQVLKPVAAIASNSAGAGTLSAVTQGIAYTCPETLTNRWQYLPFTVPVAFPAATRIFCGIVRTDGLGSFVLPIDGMAAGAWNLPLPGKPRRFASIASNNPVNGIAYADQAPGFAMGIGLAYRLP
jgi:hypothetical protein